jgi:hypothetical protein
MNHASQLRKRLSEMPLREPPPPWKIVGCIAVGGLMEVGFAEGTDLLLVISSTGRGVFDCRTGEKVARDYDGLENGWHDPIRLTALGIGPLAGKTVRVAGLCGGGLPLMTTDGWGIQVVFPKWPDAIVILEPRGSSVFVERMANNCVKLADLDTPRAWGFSDSGKSLALAESHTLTLFSRE